VRTAWRTKASKEQENALIAKCIVARDQRLEWLNSEHTETPDYQALFDGATEYECDACDTLFWAEEKPTAIQIAYSKPGMEPKGICPCCMVKSILSEEIYPCRECGIPFTDDETDEYCGKCQAKFDALELQNPYIPLCKA
jgi:rubrerythrin